MENLQKEKKIKILQVIPVFAYGGVEKVVMNYYSNLDHDKYSFDFITHGTSAPYVNRLLDDGCKIYEIQTIGAGGISNYKKQLVENLDIRIYDIVHIHLGHLTGLYAKVFREIGAKKIICHAHTTKCVNRKHVLFMPIFRWLTKRYADCRIACGKESGK